MFYRATVTCPSCFKKSRDASERCSACGFDALQAVQKFQFTPPTLDCVIDSAGLLDEKTIERITLTAQTLKAKFPQFGFYFCLVDMGNTVNLSEFAFWMMNACRLQDGQTEMDRAWSVLLVIDSVSGQVALTPGYAAEAFIEDSGWEAAIRDISPLLREAQYGDAILNYLTHAEKLLHTAALFVKGKLK
ncbi:MAG: TPM domain-containing protein [Akkermansiaceae bacterium]